MRRRLCGSPREASRCSTCSAPTDAARARPPAQSNAPEPLRRPVKIRHLFACARRQAEAEPNHYLTKPEQVHTPPSLLQPHPATAHGHPTAREERDAPAPRARLRLAYNFPRLVSSSLSLLFSLPWLALPPRSRSRLLLPPNPNPSARVFYSIPFPWGGRAEPIQHAVRASRVGRGRGDISPAPRAPWRASPLVTEEDGGARDHSIAARPHRQTHTQRRRQRAD